MPRLLLALLLVSVVVANASDRPIPSERVTVDAASSSSAFSEDPPSHPLWSRGALLMRRVDAAYPLIASVLVVAVAARATLELLRRGAEHRRAWGLEPAFKQALAGRFPPAATATVSSLTIYPIKSCKGIQVPQATVDPTGFRNDRAWMVVDAASGRMVTQRQIPEMGLIHVAVGFGEHRVTFGNLMASMLHASGLWLTAPRVPGAGRIWVPLCRPRRAAVSCGHTSHRSGRWRNVTVWGRPCRGVDQGDDVAEWLSSVLGSACRLVHTGTTRGRPVASKYDVAPGKNDRVGFADGFPFLLISEETLEDLNARLVARDTEAMPMNRFRPNMTTEGDMVSVAPYAEDTWRRLLIAPPPALDGGRDARGPAHGQLLQLRGVKRCARCKIPTTDQETAAQGGFEHGEPLVTLRQYRKQGAEVYFGMNLIHDATAAGKVVRVGDSVFVLEEGPTPPWPKDGEE